MKKNSIDFGIFLYARGKMSGNGRFLIFFVELGCDKSIDEYLIQGKVIGKILRAHTNSPPNDDQYFQRNMRIF